MSEDKEKVDVFETPDLGFAAYLRMKDLKLKGIGKDNKRFKFLFENKKDKIEEFKLEFINSESYRFDSNVRILKLMIKSNGSPSQE